MRFSLCCGLVAAALASGGAPAQTAGDASGTAEAQPAEEGAAWSLETVLVEVDGTKLTLGDLVAIRRELPQQYQQLPDELLFNALLEQMTDQILLARAAEEAGLDRQPAVALRILNQDRAILAEAYLKREITARITEDAVEALYTERYVNAEPVEEIKAAHILVDSREKAEEIIAKLADGADFAALAKEYGTDGTASRGGDLGWFVRSDMVPAFADAAFALEPGSVSGPVETDFGWHVIRVEDRRMRKAPPFEEVKAELAGELLNRVQEEAVAALRARAEIRRAESLPPASAIRDDALLEAQE